MTTDPNECLRRINQNLGVANVLSAAGLVQQRQLVDQNRRLEHIARQSLDEERAWRMSMWLQTPDGIAFARWRESALAVAAELRRRDDLWIAAWRTEVETVIPPHERQMVREGRYVPAPQGVRLQRSLPPAVLLLLVAPLGLFCGLLAFGNFLDGAYFLALFFFAPAAGIAALAMWRIFYRDSAFHAYEQHIADVLRQRRVAHFGVDPLAVPEQIPVWSQDGAHVYLVAAIEHTLARAWTEFPHPNELPALGIPLAVAPSQTHIRPHQQLLAAGFAAPPR